jgi:hypothetical protein
MALIAKAGTPSLSSVLPPQNSTIVGLVAGEDIAAGDVCYIKNDGTVERSNGTSANAAAKADGIALIAAKEGDPVTIARHVNVRYGSGLTPGGRVYVGATAGRLDDGATTGGTAPVGFVVDATRIHFHGSYY